MMGISASVMSPGYRTNMAFNTSVDHNGSLCQIRMLYSRALIEVENEEQT